jgi:hypothetical protein
MLSLDDCLFNEMEFGMDDHVKISPVLGSKEEDVGSSRSEHCIPDSSVEIKTEHRHLDVTEMIRSLQRTEGSNDCFRRGNACCDQLSCAWRQYCLDAKEGVNCKE